MRSSVQVGIITSLATALLAGAFFFLGRSVLNRPTYLLNAQFSDVKGLRAGANVLLSGVNIGSVEEVELKDSRLVNVRMRVDKRARIPLRSKVRIPGAVLFPGDQRLEIVPPPIVAGYVEENATLVGESSGGLDELMPGAQTALAELNRTLTAVRTKVEDPELNRNIRAVMGNLSRSLEQISLLTTQARSVLSANRATIEVILRNVASASREMDIAARSANGLLADASLRNNLKATLESVKHAAEYARNASASLNEIVSDPRFQQNISVTTQNVRDISESGKEIATNTSTLTNQAKGVMDDVKVVTMQAIGLTEDARRLVNHLDEIANTFPRFGGGGGGATPEFRLDFIYDLDTSLFRTDAMARVPFKGNAIIAGVYDATESNKIIAQYEVQESPLYRMRYGVYASKPGVGVDYQPSRRLGLVADLYDPNDLQLDLRLSLQFGDNWAGWVGIDGLFNRTNPIVGVQLRR